MELNQSTLRGILAQILSINPKYVVPKQGNWWNPQEKAFAPDTWCAYLLRNNRPISIPYYDGVDTNRVCVRKIATIDLQFVGPQAEAMAQNVSTWALRGDVQTQFAKVQGAIMYSGMDVVATNFYQDGSNNVMAYNTQIRVQWVQIVTTGQTKITGASMGGDIDATTPTR